MPQVAVDLVTNNKISGEALAAAKAMDRLAASEKKLLGTSKSAAAVQRKAFAEQAKAFRIREREGKKQEKAVKQLARGDISEALNLGAGGIAAGIMAAALAAGAIAAAGLAVHMAKIATEANTAKNNAVGMMNVLTGGRGTEALTLVDGLAEQLGMKFQTAREHFIKFRQAGADNKLSASMIKLVADLNTVDSSGKLAAEAIDKILSHKDAAGKLDLKGAAAEMELLAKQAGVAGTGAAAAAARFTTLGGALGSLDNTKTQALEEIGKRIQPALDKAAGAAAKFFDEFLKSEQGQKAIDGIVGAITRIISFGEAMLPIVGAAIKGVTEGFEILSSAISPVLDAIGKAFGGDKQTAILAVTESVKVLTIIIGGFTAALFGAVAIIGGAFAVALTGISKIIEVVGTALGDFAFKAVQFGSALVDGLINGITGSAGRLYSRISSLADNAWGTFKSKLGIGSPSKAFAELGKFSMQGYEEGAEDNAPNAGAAAGKVLDAATPSPMAGGSSTSVDIPSIVINIMGGDDPAAIAREVRRELQLALSSLFQSRGVPV